MRRRAAAARGGGGQEAGGGVEGAGGGGEEEVEVGPRGIGRHLDLDEAAEQVDEVHDAAAQLRELLPRDENRAVHTPQRRVPIVLDTRDDPPHKRSQRVKHTCEG
jgi:hypothetical protein